MPAAVEYAVAMSVFIVASITIKNLNTTTICLDKENGSISYSPDGVLLSSITNLYNATCLSGETSITYAQQCSSLAIALNGLNIPECPI